jgi:hypothetical protein
MLLKTLLIFALFSTSAIAKNKKKPWSYLYTRKHFITSARSRTHADLRLAQNCTSDAKENTDHSVWSRRFNPNKDESRKDEIAGGLGGARRYSLMLPKKVDKGTPDYCFWMFYGTQGTGQSDQAQVFIDCEWSFEHPPSSEHPRLTRRS